MSENKFEQYYKSYHADKGEAGYTGDRHHMTSRFLLFKEQIEKYVPKGGKILDIGCGSGTFAAQNPDYEWHGIDWDVSKAEDKNIDVMTHNVEEFPYPYVSGSFDAVVCSEVLEHCFDPVAIHKEARRLLKRDGQYMLSTPNHTWLVNIVQGFQNLVYNPTLSHTVEHIRTYDYEAHKMCLNAAGFVIEEHRGSCAHFDGILNPMVHQVVKMIDEKYKVQVSPWEIHLELGRAHPSIQHTIFLRSVKA